MNAYATTAKVFSFSSKLKNSGNGYECSATMIKHQGKCHLLTNNHCVENKKDFKINFLKSSTMNISNYLAEQFPTREDISPINISLLKVNPRLDLAILNYTSEELKKECEDLKNISLNGYENDVNSNLEKVFAATGIVNNSPIMKFTSDMPWDNGIGPSQVVYDYQLGDGAFFLYVSDFEIIPGMSGSPVISYGGNFIGMATKYVDFQSSSLLIPTPMIIKFIEGKIEEMPEADLSNFQINSLNNAGNEHGGAGNEHGGAGNEHAGAGNGLNEVGLSSFRAPEEGILINNKIVLGFTSKAGFPSKIYYHQIDGMDDYQTKVNDSSYIHLSREGGKFAQFITREVNDYPEINIRKKIIERMDGYFYLDFSNEVGAAPFNQKYLSFVPNPKALRGLEKVGNLMTLLSVDLNSKKKQLIIEGQGVHHTFNLSYSIDYKQIFLTNQNHKLVCENKNLLKLICKDDKMELSLSVNNTSKYKHVKYRLAYKENFRGMESFAYRFGTIGATDVPEKWR